jgi:succinyl-CoA synthetase alpha subunit
MSILIDNNTKVLVQGITGRDGSFHALQMRAYGTQVVGGVTPGKGGQNLEGIPVFNTVQEAKQATDANATVIFVPAPFAKSAMLEAIHAGIPLVVCITEGVAVLDMVDVMKIATEKKVRVIGPNCPGLITPGQCKIGIMPGFIHKPGTIGVVSRSGTLTYEVVHMLTNSLLGQSTCIGVGGDPIIGMRFIDVIQLFMNDPGTEGIVMVGEIGGADEQIAADYIKKNPKKPVVGFIAGKSAPEGKRMGHAGAIIGAKGTSAADKIDMLKASGVEVASFPDEIPALLKKRL